MHLLLRWRLLLTFRHRAGVRPYTSSLNFAKPCVFVKQSPGPFLCALPSLGRDPFSLSYGINLPSSLAMNHSSTCGYSPWLPVSVCGTGHYILKLSGFSWKSVYCVYPLCRSIKVLSGFNSNGGFACHYQYLHPLTYYSVSTLAFHSSVSTFADIVSIGILTNCPST